jgi:protocatechuate 3,4-dioxygenase beta subunit
MTRKKILRPPQQIATGQPNAGRRLLLGALGCALVSPSAVANAIFPATPAQTAGPFYPPVLPLDDDADLTRVEGKPGQAAGQITDLTGRVLDNSGRPLTGVRVEIWQCDANGRYRHPAERGSAPVDPHFQGHGHAVTDALGRYRFRTIRPVPYPGRTPHVHAAVLPRGGEPLVTQIYVRGESGNQDDFLFKRIPLERRELVLAEFRRTERPDAELSARFDFVLGQMPVEG